MRLSVLALALLCPAIAAQTKTFTSPFGYDTKEGASNHGYILASNLGLTWQQIDNTLRGKVAVAKSIAWRRDGTLATNTAYVARNMEMEVYMSSSDVVKTSTTHSLNYIGTPTQCVKKKTFKAPDWSTKPTTSPAPFNFKIVFDKVYLHNGKNDLLWEVRVSKNDYTGTAFTNYPFDFQRVVSGGSFTATPTSSASQTNGSGCTVSGATSPFTLSSTVYNHRNKFRLIHGVTNAPKSTLVNNYFDVTDPNANLGWCAKLRTGANFIVPLGMSSSTGAASKTVDNIPYFAFVVGARLYAQSAAWDATKSSVALSNGITYTIPADPNYPKVGRVYSYTGRTASRWTGGIVTQFGL